MLTEIYIEALLIDPETADQVWGAWDTGQISTYWAIQMWRLITLNAQQFGDFSTTVMR